MAHDQEDILVWVATADNAVSGAQQNFLVSGLCFYDTHPEYLAKHVRSLAGHADALVGLDGVFRGLSDQTSSPLEQYEAIAETAHDVGLPYTIYKGREYESEPSKRTALVGAVLQEFPDASHLLAMDGDEWLHSEIDWDKVERYKMGVAAILDYEDDEHVGAPEGVNMPRIFPLSPSLRWGPLHFDIRDKDRIYIGHERGLTTKIMPAFSIGHQRKGKKIEDAYQAYNDSHRARAEGKSGRALYANEQEIAMLMDIDGADQYQVDQATWFTKGMIGRGAWAIVREKTEPDEFGMLKVYWNVLSESEGRRLAARLGVPEGGLE